MVEPFVACNNNIAYKKLTVLKFRAYCIIIIFMPKLIILAYMLDTFHFDLIIIQMYFLTL